MKHFTLHQAAPNARSSTVPTDVITVKLCATTNICAMRDDWQQERTLARLR